MKTGGVVSLLGVGFRNVSVIICSTFPLDDGTH